MSQHLAYDNTITVSTDLETEAEPALWNLVKPLACFCLAVLYILMMCGIGIMEAVGIHIMKIR